MNYTKTLRILQYNVNHGKDATLVPLLQDTRVHEFDILAIQEPWRNPFTTTSYNPRNAPFHLAYPPKPLSRVCIYINKRIHPNSWTVTHHTEDAQTVTIRYGPNNHQRTLQVHNIYNPSPSSYSSQDQGTLETLRNCLQEPADDHIVVGDFNLHHPLWSGLARLTQHAAADILLDIARNASLELVTKCGIETWRARGTYSTIDLSFISQDLGEKLIKCVTRPDIAQSSDHIPIETSLDLQTQLFETDRKRCWKRLDTGKLLERLRQASLPDLELTSRAQIDTYICALTQAFTNGIEASVPWQRGSQYARSYWSTECAEAVRETRRKYYDMLREATQESEEIHRHARSRKVATIRRAKQKEFREHIANATSTPQGVYRLAKWARLKAGRPRELPQLPQLVAKRRNESGETVTVKFNTLPEKLNALREKFFPQPKQADLTDIDPEKHPEPLEVDEEISEEEIHEALQHVANDKAPGPDQIPNRVLKEAEE